MTERLEHPESRCRLSDLPTEFCDHCRKNRRTLGVPDELLGE